MKIVSRNQEFEILVRGGGGNYSEKIQREATFGLNYLEGQEINGLRSQEILHGYYIPCIICSSTVTFSIIFCYSVFYSHSVNLVDKFFNPHLSWLRFLISVNVPIYNFTVIL